MQISTLPLRTDMYIGTLIWHDTSSKWAKRRRVPRQSQRNNRNPRMSNETIRTPSSTKLRGRNLGHPELVVMWTRFCKSSPLMRRRAAPTLAKNTDLYRGALWMMTRNKIITGVWPVQVVILPGTTVPASSVLRSTETLHACPLKVSQQPLPIDLELCAAVARNEAKTGQILFRLKYFISSSAALTSASFCLRRGDSRTCRW